MCNLPHATIDASVLAVPLNIRNADEFSDYLENILEWGKLVDEPWIAVSLTSSVAGSLIYDDLYPIREKLKELFLAHNIYEYTVKDVANVIDRLLNRTPSFETFFKLNDILYEEISTEPDIIRIITTKHLQSDLARCVLLMAILRRHCSQPLGGHSLIIRNAAAKRVSVKARIHDFEHTRDDINGLVLQPDYFEGEILACDNFPGLIECIDETAILTGAYDNDGIELAIRLYIYKERLKTSDEIEINKITIPRIGAQFLSTCQQCCEEQDASLPSRILRSIYETMYGLNLRDVHALRTGPGGNAPQRMRGGDGAQRRDIDREFHIHYWDCENGTIELASVVYHDEFSIPY